jgi:Domain of unknown function (DUF4145)
VPPGPAGRYGVHCLPSGPGVSPSASPLAPTLGVMKSTQTLKWLVTGVALALLAARLLWPHLSIDSIALGLLIVAILPWASTLIESAKFPGGWEVKFRDLKAASTAIESGSAKQSDVDPQAEKNDSFQAVARPIMEADANLALVALRIEIEKRMRNLAYHYDVPMNLPLTRLFKELRDKDVLPDGIASSLQEIIQAGNRAAHGASVEPTVQNWAIESSTKILRALDDLLKPEVKI